MSLAKNKKAKFNFQFIEKFVAGIVLKGDEVPQIKHSNVSNV